MFYSGRHVASVPAPVVPRLRVAIVGAGIAGLSSAWHVSRLGGQPTLYEAQPRLGGHAHTVDVTMPDAAGREVRHGVDVGFLVFNRRTYPGLIGFFDALGIETAPSDMSFSVQSPGLDGAAAKLEWSGSDANGVFAQRRNLVSPRFWSMLAQILRFNRLGTELVRAGRTAGQQGPSEGSRSSEGDDPRVPHETVASFLERHHFDRNFRDGYLLPMIACIWSCPVEQMLEFPVATLLRFCDNHGLMQVRDRPPWFTVRGGSRHYVDAVARALPDVRVATPVLGVERVQGGVVVRTAAGRESFDAIVLACHGPQALALLGGEAEPLERSILGAIRTQRNQAVLHTDASLMPQQRRAWAAWNFERSAPVASDRLPVCLHYWIQRLQPVPFVRDVFVSLNPCREPDPASVLGRWEVDHPVFDLGAIEAQSRLGELQGQRSTWFAGAWCGYGFHEDGFQAGRCAASEVMALPVDMNERVAA